MTLTEVTIYSIILGIALALASYLDITTPSKFLSIVKSAAKSNKLDSAPDISYIRDEASKTTYGAGWWTDDDIFQLERRAYFSKRWLYVTHASKFQKPGDYRTFEIAGFSFIVMLGKDRKLRAFHNICRHRAYAVTKKECGSSLVLGCRYHGWSYDTQGKLIKAPEFDKVEGFNKDMNGLWELKLDVRSSMVFVNLHTGDNALAFELAEFRNLATWRIADLQWISEWKIEGRFNWKLAIDELNNPPESDIATTGWSSFLTTLFRSEDQSTSTSSAALFRRLDSGGLLTIKVLPQTPDITIFECNIYEKSCKRTSALQKNIDVIKAHLTAEIKQLEAKQQGLTHGSYSSTRQDRLSAILKQHLVAENALGAEIHPAARVQSFTQDGKEDDDLCKELEADAGGKPSFCGANSSGLMNW